MPRWPTWMFGFALLLSGCDWFAGEEEPLIEEPSAARVTEAAPAPTEPQPETLELQLQPGQRFPLQKTIEQTLTQTSGENEVSSHSILRMLLRIDVAEVTDDGRKRLQVRYHNVRYEQELPGERLIYDSTSPPETIPVWARPYHGLVDNGFQFWLGPNNRIVDLIGFESFLERCVTDVPPQQREEVLAKLAQTTGEEGIANFIDDSIGLLPYDDEQALVKPGDSWITEQRYRQPVPIYLQNRCTLKELTPEHAQIDILGEIAAGKFNPPADPQRELDIVVRGGHTLGAATIRRDTGLPVQSRVERFIEMQVRVPDGQVFDQHKRIVTTIRTFPESSIQQVSAEVHPPQ